MRLTDLPGVSSGLPRTVEGCKEALRRYELHNADLPDSARRLLALAAVGKYFGRRLLEQAVGQALPRFPFRDWSWRWWNVLHFSGLDERWTKFSRHAQSGGLRDAAAYLRKNITPDTYRLFLRRAGTNPHNDHRLKRGRFYWTKGGNWHRDNPFSQLLVAKKHLPRRPLVKRWQRRLGHEGVRLIERELMKLINPDETLVHEAKHRAVDYVRRRIKDLVPGYPAALPSVGAAVWFYQWPMYDKGHWLAPDETGAYITEVPVYHVQRRHLVEW